MKYYIIKQVKDPVDPNLTAGIREIDPDAEIVHSLGECDIAVLQRGWTRSRVAVTEKNRQTFVRHKPCREGYVYTERFLARTARTET